MAQILNFFGKEMIFTQFREQFCILVFVESLLYMVQVLFHSFAVNYYVIQAGNGKQ